VSLNIENVPRISIITACYNSGKYIETTIKSVIEQSYRNIEYIIVDGGSVDSTMDIVNRYADKINMIVSEPDDGIYDAFNKGIKMSTGDIIYFLNSDDYLYEPDTIKLVAKVFTNNPNIRIVYGNVKMFDDISSYSYIKGRALRIDDLKKREMVPHQAVFVSRELFDVYGLFNTRYRICSDLDFMIKCFKNNEHNMKYIDRIIAAYRVGGISTDSKHRCLLEAEASSIIMKHFNIFRENGIIELQKVQGLYRNWLESLLLKGEGISKTLHKYGVNNVAIFGTMKTALYLQKDLQDEEFSIVAFLDNNCNMHNAVIGGIAVYPTEWLRDNIDKIDAVILSIESSGDIEVKEQISKLIDDAVLILSWKELAEKALE